MSQTGSLRQKCDLGRRAQNLLNNRLCFFTHQAFSIFIALAVPWDSNFDPCCKRVILTGARKNHIKAVYAFLPIRHFPFSFLWLSLWGPNLDPCCKSVILKGAREIHIKAVCVFLPIRHFAFSLLWLSLGVPT